MPAFRIERACVALNTVGERPHCGVTPQADDRSFPAVILAVWSQISGRFGGWCAVA